MTGATTVAPLLEDELDELLELELLEDELLELEEELELDEELELEELLEDEESVTLAISLVTEPPPLVTTTV
jgi:hypothetical protein